MERVDEWLGYARPDVLLMQETKMSEDQFPHDHFAQLGYESVHSGEGRWNGVAILSSVGIEEPFKGFADGCEEDPEARIVSAICGGIKVSSVYVPNGREVDHDHYRYKLSWMARLKGHLEATCQPDDLLLVGGDYNICPDDRDVWDPQNPISRTHVTKKERDALTALEQWGLADVFTTSEKLREEALALAASIAANAPLALLSIRATMREGIADRVRSETDRENREQLRLSGTDDFQEGLRAMTERRPGNFSGQ